MSKRQPRDPFGYFAEQSIVELIDAIRDVREKAANMRMAQLGNIYPEIATLTVKPLGDPEVVIQALTRELDFQKAEIERMLIEREAAQ